MTAVAEHLGTLGPAMTALTEKQRAFVYHYFQAPRKHGAGTYAARAAGYGHTNSSRQSLSQMAYQLLGDEKVLDAIQEESRKYITALGPPAVRALGKLIADPKARDHGRALGLVLERVSPADTTLTVKHDATPAFQNTAEVMARVVALAAKFNIALPGPKVINAVANEAQS
jgi:phage terminase small subunit